MQRFTIKDGIMELEFSWPLLTWDEPFIVRKNGNVEHLFVPIQNNKTKDEALFDAITEQVYEKREDIYEKVQV